MERCVQPFQRSWVAVENVTNQSDRNCLLPTENEKKKQQQPKATISDKSVGTLSPLYGFID